ncbi:hypothetical protein ACWDNI_35700 [Nocardia niigatensis]
MGKHALSHKSWRARALVRLIIARRAGRIGRKSAPQCADDDTQPMTMPTVRNGALELGTDTWDAELPWNEWLQNLPPVDGWTSIASWMAQHGLEGGAR